MKTTISFNHERAKQYAVDLFNVDTIVYSTDKKAEALLILIGLDTALRVSDLLRLKFTDVDGNGNPTVTAYVSKKKRQEIKPITSTTLRLLEKYKTHCIEHHGYISEFIFFNYKNEQLYTRQWTHKRLNLANDNGKLGRKVDVAGAHSLRRTAGANVFEKTKDLRDVQFLMGHDRLSQTEHYLKLDQTQALERLAKIYQ